MKHFTILDFTTGEVHIYTTKYNIDPDPEETVSNLGHNPDNCQWMLSDGTITFHKDVLE